MSAEINKINESKDDKELVWLTMQQVQHHLALRAENSPVTFLLTTK